MFDLPAELMYKIFTELHLSLSAEEVDFFPYTLAAVCQTWREMLSRSPEYWTRVVLDVNHPHPLPVDVFSWSRSLPLSVVVLSQNNSRDDRSKIAEHRRLSEITTALIPHVHRCHSISFQVTYESSLPSPLLFLSQDHTTLSSLHLDCLIQDEAAGLSIGHHLQISKKLPMLKSVLITGRAFLELCRTQPAWHEIGNNNPLCLTISQYQFPRGTTRPGDTITEFTKYLERMRGLKDLKLKRLSLDYTPDGSPSTRYPQHFILNSLHLEDLDHIFLTEFFKTVAGDCQQITISGCPVPAGSIRLTTENLILEAINDKAAIKSALLSHRGAFLTVRSCPGFDDDILEWMASTVDKDSPRSPATWATALDISDCPGATPSGLIPLIHYRANIVGTPFRAGRHMGVLPYLKRITISKKGPAPTVSQEYRRWFVGQMRTTHVMCNVQSPEGKIVTVLEA